ncbi:MAG: AMP-binding protein, partial [Pseudomonadota bacterium]
MDWYPKRRFGDLPREMAARFPHLVGLVFNAQNWTFLEIDREIDRASKALMSMGVGSGDHVALWLNNRAEWIFLMFALARVGAVQIPVNTRFRTEDLKYVLNQSDACMLITHDVSGPQDYQGMAADVLALPQTGHLVNDPAYPMFRQLVIVGSANQGAVTWSDALSQGEGVSESALTQREASVDPDAPVFIMYTSGTTGFPKGVVHSHKLIRNIEERAFRMGISEADTMLNYLPLFHAFAYSECALMSMVTGARQIVTETFDPDESLDLIASEQVTLIHGFEAHLSGLCDAQEAKPRDVSSLRTGLFASGMHSATPVAYRGARVLAPLTALSAYGMTEVWVGAAVSALDDDEEHRLERSGYPAPGYEMRIVDPGTGDPIPTEMPGELQV